MRKERRCRGRRLLSVVTHKTEEFTVLELIGNTGVQVWVIGRIVEKCH